MRARALALSLTASLLLSGCGSDGPTGLTPNVLPVTVSGTIQIRNGTTIPANARALVLWGVSSGSPDYSYVFGEGTVNAATGQFSVTFTASPPAAALNSGKVGVALVILTTDQTLAQGQVPGSYAFPGLIGMTEDHSVIFVNSSAGAAGLSWESRFPEGYSAGEVERSTTTFDSFKRVGLTTLRLVVDAIENINPPNWT